MKLIPRLSIGLPVFNGEQYLQEALDSHLNQTYDDFELIVSDNASTDATQEICCQYASCDKRICYCRNERNMGAAWNFNHVFKLSSGKYFKWAAHDDILHPEYLERCIQVLDRRPEIILCYSKTAIIDQNSRLTGSYCSTLASDAQDAYRRFHDIVLVSHPCTSVFGVVRPEILCKTQLIGSYVGSDLNLLAELALLGPMYEIQDFLFLRREHPQSSIRKFNYYDRLVWFEGKESPRLNLPYWKNGIEYFRSVLHFPLDRRQKLLCSWIVFSWFYMRRKHLVEDIKGAIYYLLVSKKLYRPKSQ